MDYSWRNAAVQLIENRELPTGVGCFISQLNYFMFRRISQCEVLWTSGPRPRCAGLPLAGGMKKAGQWGLSGKKRMKFFSKHS